MNANVGTIDRTLRIVAGLAILSLFFILDGNARYWGLLGIVPILTGSLRVCPVYPLLGINTCGTDKR
ncbi:MAG: YgaP family membrane protein [Steroidobacteraceae bacterium]